MRCGHEWLRIEESGILISMRPHVSQKAFYTRFSLALLIFVGSIFAFAHIANASSGWTLIQNSTSTPTCADSTHCSVTVPAPGDGDLLVLAVSGESVSSSVISSVTGGSNWVLPATSGCFGWYGSSSGYSTQCAYTLSSASTTTTISWTFASAQWHVAANVLEYASTNGPITFDTAGERGDNSFSVNHNGVGLSLNGTNDLILQLMDVSNATTTAISGAYSDPFNCIFSDIGITSQLCVGGSLNTYDGTAPVWSTASSKAALAAIAFKDASLPIISSFSATPSSIQPGATSTLAWNIIGTPTSVSVDNGIGSQSTATSSSVVIGPAVTTTYTLSVANSYGTTTASTTVSVGAPTAPQSLAAAFGNTQVSLSWIAPTTDNGSAITNYLIYDRQTGSQTFSLATTISPTQTNAIITSLTNGQGYDFEVVARNANGDSLSSNVVSTTPCAVPGAPTNVAAMASGYDSAVISFSIPSSNGSAITKYTVTSSPDNITATSTGNNITVGGLASGTSYTFSVVATNIAGNSAASVSSNGTVPVTTHNSPILNFSDITSGPKTGLGDGKGSGAIVTIWGDNLGASQGTSDVYIKDSAGNTYPATYIYYWKNADGQLPGGPAVLYNNYQKMQEIAFSIPAQAADGAAKIYVAVNGVNSNVLPFTIKSGSIYFIASSGSDTTGDGSWSAPWATVSHMDGTRSCLVSPGDIVYLENGVTATNFSIYHCSGSSGDNISAVAYPDSRVTFYGLSNGQAAVANYNSASNFWNFSKITAIADQTGFNSFQAARYVGNEITDQTCATGESGAIAGSDNYNSSVDVISNIKALGNYIHDWGCDSTSKLEHDFYLSNRGGSIRGGYELGWNYLANNKAEHALHLYDEGVCGDYSSPILMHDNVVVNQRGTAVDVGSGGTTSSVCYSMPVKIYNNLFVNVGQGPAMVDGTVWCSFAAFHGVNNYAQIQFYNNTVYGWGDQTAYDAGQCAITYGFWTGNGTTTTGDLFSGGGAGSGSIDFRNNIIYATQNPTDFPYFGGSYNPGTAANDLWYNAGTPPAWESSPVNSDPLFSNPSANNFTLQSTSPAVNSGTSTVSSLITTDINGLYRPQNFWDMGAYKYTHSYYLSSSGSDLNSGYSASTPWKNLSKAILSPDVVYATTGTATSTEQITFNNKVQITLGSGAVVTVPSNTTMSATATIDFSQMDATSTVSTSNIPSGYVSLGAVSFGDPTHSLASNNLVTIQIPISSSYNGQTLTILREEPGSSSWTNTGTTCTVASGVCQFTTQTFSQFSASSATVDTIPPVLSGGSPSSSLSSGTTQTTLSVTTNENATCRYSTTANTSYSSMTDTFTTTGTTSHSTTIIGLSDGNSYTYYVRCQDSSGNANTTDYAISFSIASASSGGGGGGGGSIIVSSGGGGGGGAVSVPTASAVPASSNSVATTTDTVTAAVVPTGTSSSLTSNQINAILFLLTSFGADQNTINSVHAALLDRPSSTQTAPSTASVPIFTANLAFHANLPEVKELQQFLNTHGFTVSRTGPGSLGNETDYFGPATYRALVRFQAAHGLPATGYFGPMTRRLVKGML